MSLEAGGHIPTVNDIRERIADVGIEIETNALVKSGFPEPPQTPDLVTSHPGLYSHGKITEELGKELGPAAPGLNDHFNIASRTPEPAVKTTLDNIFTPHSGMG